MNLNQCINLLLSCAAAATLAACASAPADNVASADGTQLAAVSKPIKCKPSDAQTGTSIVRKDCSSNSDVQSVDGRDFMDQRRTSLPDKPQR